jgi:hypothetical protein
MPFFFFLITCSFGRATTSIPCGVYICPLNYLCLLAPGLLALSCHTLVGQSFVWIASHTHTFSSSPTSLTIFGSFCHCT